MTQQFLMALIEIIQLIQVFVKVPTVQISNASEILDVKKNDQLITLRYCSDSLECEKYHVNGHVDTALNTFKCVPTTEESVEQPTMDRSVDSIGTCSLDVEVSADFSGTKILCGYFEGNIYIYTFFRIYEYM